PPGGVRTRQGLAVVAEHPPPGVRDDPADGVEGHVGERRTEVAHRPVDGLDVELLEPSGAADAAVAGELGAFGAQALDLAVADDLHGTVEEVQVYASRVPRGRTQRPVGEGLDDLAGLV